MRRPLGTCTALLLAVLPSSSPARAATTGSETLLVSATGVGNGAVFTFSASGTFTDDGVSTSTSAVFHAGSSPVVATEFRTTTYSSAHGAGTFTLKSPVLISVAAPNTLALHGEWVVVGGTGRYASLRGAGTLSGTFDLLTLTTNVTLTGHVTLPR